VNTGASTGASASAGGLAALVWPLERLGEALSELALQAGLAEAAVANPAAAIVDGDPMVLERWMTAAGLRIGVEAETVTAYYGDVAALLWESAPLLVRHPAGVLAVVAARGKTVRLLGPDHALHRVPLAVVRHELLHRYEGRAREKARLALGDLPAAQRVRAEETLVTTLLARTPGCMAWMLRVPPGAPFGVQLRRSGMRRLGGWLLLAHLVQHALFILSWWAVGAAVLSGRPSPGLLLCWVLLLVTMVPLRMLTTQWHGRLSIGIGTLLKRRLLQGTLHLDTDVVRKDGVGALLGRTIEAEAVERLALSGGLLAALALVELALAMSVLAAGAGGGWQVGALLAWLVVTAALGVRLARRRVAWTALRLGLTEATVERMVGHRTRLAQAHPARWHAGEDEGLRGYFERSTRLDRAHAALLVGVPHGWMVLGMLTLAPSFVGGASSTALAVAAGGVLLGWQSLQRLVNGIDQAIDARVAWDQVAPIFHAAAHGEVPASPDHAAVPPARDASVAVPVVEARALRFRYPGKDTAVLRDCDLEIRHGDRVLLMGPSGGGKSTLASLLLGVRTPGAGILLLGGLDLPSLGEMGWRRRAAAAPQFHENHVLTETFAFNLLMGRRWPAMPEDMAEAQAIVEELGLGPLLERMPAGMHQIVGETGWQLSHGERSRLFIARALLQDTDLVVLDESFAALDPENLERAMRCVKKRARALVVIAHP
jgi:ATP-binding cassette subfamily B protein